MTSILRAGKPFENGLKGFRKPLARPNPKASI